MPRHAVFLGDLLRALHHAQAGADRDAVARALGFHPKQTEEQGVQRYDDAEVSELTQQPPAHGDLTAPPPQDNRTQPWLWRVAADLPNPDAQTERPAWLQQAIERPLTAARFESNPTLRLPAPAPLQPRGRVLRLLHQQLARPLSAGVPDVPWLVRRLSAGQPVRRLSWLQRPRWPHRVHVLCQAHPALGPLAADGLAVAAEVQRLLGRRVQRMHAPAGPYRLQPGPHQPVVPLRRDGALVLVLGDAGLLQPGSALAVEWAAWAAEQARAGPVPFLLAPLPRRLLATDTARHFRVALLDDTTSPRWLRPPPAALPARRAAVTTAPPNTATDALPADAPATTALLGVLAGLSCVDHALLRHARRALRPLGADLALEAQLLQHPAVTRDGAHLRVLSAQEQTALAGLAKLHRLLQATGTPAAHAQATAICQALACVNAASRGLSPLLRAVRQQLLSQHLPADLQQAALDDDAADQARRLWEDAAAWFHTGQDDAALGLAAHLRWLGRTQARLVGAAGPALQAAWVLALGPGGLQRRRQLPPGLNLADLQWLQRASAAASPQALVLQGGAADATVQLVPVAQAHGALLATGLPGQAHATVARLPAVGDAVGSAPVPLPLRTEAVATVQPDWRWRLFVGARQLDLEAFDPPAWALQVEHDGPHWRAQAPDGRWLRWVPQGRFTLADAPGEFTLPHGAWWDEAEYLAFAGPTHSLRCPGWANAGHGVDALGHWAAFEVQGVRQTMRFIPPGAFVMGSPLTDPDRSDDERPHPVVLTRGFWLADTACTQELWRAVTGGSPSHFKGDDLPVEQVSWNDIQQQFLLKIARRVPGLRLPTEAEWEFAARNAGREAGQFWWGDGMNTDQANYDGHFPLKGGREGVDRRKTLAVRSFQPSPLGLWQTHGNVWEWLRDKMADYSAEVVDPTGPPEQDAPGERVLRGGGWLNDARDCRSAQRHAYDPSLRNHFFGFRLARGLPDQPASQQTYPAAAGGRAEPGPVFGGPEAHGAGSGATAPAAPQRGGLLRRIFGKDDTP
jgi:formylglycine-generating enzyme required for sulfatase activity